MPKSKHMKRVSISSLVKYHANGFLIYVDNKRLSVNDLLKLKQNYLIQISMDLTKVECSTNLKLL